MANPKRVPISTDTSWSELNLSAPWPELIALLAPNSQPRPVQIQALQKGLLASRRHLIVSAPTNGGKSLVGHLAMFDAILRGKRAVLLEPLRALAQEKLEELQPLAKPLGKILGKPLRVKISTGDYRLEQANLADPPPGGELLIATPERLEALLRREGYASWFDHVGVVVVDEAHLLREGKRGLRLEFLLTSLMRLSPPPRLVLLSATIGDTAQAERWLEPCDVIRVEGRTPPLKIQVQSVQDGEVPLDSVRAWCKQALVEAENQLLIFVYQTRSAEKLARELQSLDVGVAAYHAQMPKAQREQVRKAYRAGEVRVLISTTALALGLNLPASHVLVQDNTFPGEGRLEVDALLQMLGRAGRGTREGIGTVLVKGGDRWGKDELEQALETFTPPPLLSTIGQIESPSTVAELLAALLLRMPRLRKDAIEGFFARSLGGQGLVSKVADGLGWLKYRYLAYPQESLWQLTALGEVAAKSVIPLPIASGVAGLIRDLLTIDPDDQMLAQWTALDQLLVLELLRERSPNLRSYSNKFAELLEAWAEQNPKHASRLYLEWIRPGRSEEVIGSLGLEIPSSEQVKAAQMALFRAIILLERSKGETSETLTRRYNLKNLEGQEERWRDETLWLLSGLGRVFDVRPFYFHLRTLEASPERIQRVDRIFTQLRHIAQTLGHDLQYCSPLGPLLRRMRQEAKFDGRPTVGVGTLRRLETSGIGISELVKLASEGDADLKLMRFGIRSGLAEQLISYLRQRLR